MKVLITGITGMMGGFLSRELLAAGVEVHGTYRWRSRTTSVDGIKRDLHLRECDVRDASSIRQVVADIRPDRIFHLAAQSNVLTSRHAPAETLNTNVVGLVNLLEAVRAVHPTAQVLVPGSSEEYGLQYPDELPVRETNPLRPLSPYGVSKVTQNMAGLQFFESYRTHIVRTRAFHHTGPGREDVFVESNFARQIAEIEAGLKPPVLRVGNLEIVRDYSDARDIARAYILALDKCEPGEVYNICSERGRRIGEIVDILRGLAKVELTVEQDAARVRDHEAPTIVGCAERFRQATGWAPRIAFEETLGDILNAWRHKVRAGELQRG